jgi:hypothetical protein
LQLGANRANELHLELQLGVEPALFFKNELHLDLQLGHKRSVNRANELHLELQLGHKWSANRANELHLDQLQLGVEAALFLKMSCTLTSNWDISAP